ncbi:MAG: replicative DNA helicase, partial [Lachnospiraceae bacterium]|nr:replicative DNA helicase [Lachnospiraceae bacterium]
MAEEWQSRVLPQSLDAEKSVLGSMMIDKDAIAVVSEILLGEDFYTRQNQILFDAMVELNNEGKPVDPITLKNKLVEKNIPDEIVSADFIRDMLNSVPTSANAKYYAGIVQEKATLRRLIKVVEQVANNCYNQSEPLDNILEETEKQVFKVVQKRNDSEFIPISTVVNSALDKISIAARNKGAVT